MDVVCVEPPAQGPTGPGGPDGSACRTAAEPKELRLDDHGGASNHGAITCGGLTGP